MLVESLKVFCDLVETQSFSKTAVLNSVTQSAVSQQLKSIEKRQDKQLLEREKLFAPMKQERQRASSVAPPRRVRSRDDDFDLGR